MEQKHSEDYEVKTQWLRNFQKIPTEHTRKFFDFIKKPEAKWDHQ